MSTIHPTRPDHPHHHQHIIIRPSFAGDHIKGNKQMTVVRTKISRVID